MAAVILTVHLAAAACLVAVLPGATGAGVGALALLLGVVTARDRGLLRGRGSVRGLELREDNAAEVLLADGRRLSGTVHPRRNVSRWWVTVPVRGELRRTVVVARDMLPAGEFRRLRMWALWGRVARPTRQPDAT